MHDDFIMPSSNDRMLLLINVMTPDREDRLAFVRMLREIRALPETDNASRS